MYSRSRAATAWEGRNTGQIMQEHLKSDWMSQKHCPKELERGTSAGLSHDFIQLLVYLRFGRHSFVAERLFEPHRGNQKARIRALIKSKITHRHARMSVSDFMIFMLLAAYFDFPGGVSLRKAANECLPKC